MSFIQSKHYYYKVAKCITNKFAKGMATFWEYFI